MLVKNLEWTCRFVRLRDEAIIQSKLASLQAASRRHGTEIFSAALFAVSANPKPVSDYRATIFLLPLAGTDSSVAVIQARERAG
jgi:hypothetical protein